MERETMRRETKVRGQDSEKFLMTTTVLFIIGWRRHWIRLS